MLFFLWFLKPFRDGGKSLSGWHSDTVNSLARSAFAVYLIHENSFVLRHVHAALRNGVFSESSPVAALPLAFAIALCLFSASLSADLALRGIHSRLSAALSRLASRLVAGMLKLRCFSRPGHS